MAWTEEGTFWSYVQRRDSKAAAQLALNGYGLAVKYFAEIEQLPCTSDSTSEVFAALAWHLGRLKHHRLQPPRPRAKALVEHFAVGIVTYKNQTHGAVTPEVCLRLDDSAAVIYEAAKRPPSIDPSENDPGGETDPLKSYRSVAEQASAFLSSCTAEAGESEDDLVKRTMASFLRKQAEDERLGQLALAPEDRPDPARLAEVQKQIRECVERKLRDHVRQLERSTPLSKKLSRWIQRFLWTVVV